MPPRQNRFGIPLALMVGIGLLLAATLGVFRPLESIVGFVMKPVTGLFHGGSGELEKENERLRKQVADLEGEVAKREEAKQQNDALRAQLNFAQSGNYKVAQADIISQDPSNFRQFFTIDRGSTSGIQDNMTVVYGGNLVGRIIDTTPDTAKVYLITDYNSAVPGIAQGTRASGLVKGQRGFGLSLESVQQTDTLQPGDTVITSGFGGEYPKGLVIGTVGDIKRKDADVYQSATLRPAVDFRKLESVFIILGTT